MEEIGKFSDEVFAPLCRSGDEEGCNWNDGDVSTPTGFKDAYKRYVDGGWPSLSHDPKYGGQGLPESLNLLLISITGGANSSLASYPALAQGAIRTIEAHGSETLKTQFLPALVDGRWSGTMCLTEPHCGSDLGLIQTRVVCTADGTYSITGNKIFISGGEHDLTENIVHVVLARAEGSPGGIKGLSLFIVPKTKVNSDGSLNERNQLACTALEKKMGIKASSTCAMSFDGATGYLLGEVNRVLLGILWVEVEFSTVEQN